MEINTLYNEDCVETMDNMPDDFIDLVVTSPPYFGLRSYGNETVGREENPLDYVDMLAGILSHLKRPLKSTGSLYLNIGDVYFGTKGFSRNTGKHARSTDGHYKEHAICKEDGAYLQHKQLLMLPERVAIKLQEQGFILRNRIIWEKPNPLPSFSNDRRLPVYEHIFHFTKSKKYYFDYPKAKELNHHRDVIRCGIKPFGEHKATFPEELVAPFIETTSKEGDIVYDPFGGTGTTATVAKRMNRNWISSEISKEYCDIFMNRINGTNESNVLDDFV